MYIIGTIKNVINVQENTYENNTNFWLILLEIF